MYFSSGSSGAVLSCSGLLFHSFPSHHSSNQYLWVLADGHRVRLNWMAVPLSSPLTGKENSR